MTETLEAFINAFVAIVLVTIQEVVNRVINVINPPL